MDIQEQVSTYIASLHGPKQSDMKALHQMILGLQPSVRLWFLDGKNEEGKVVSNPNIGYGIIQLATAKGGQRSFYRVGISANTTGISVYIMGIEDKQFLVKTYGNELGKARITGYCIKFKALKDIHLPTLEKAIRDSLLE